ncbi:zeta toxin family protein [Dactylosporangium sp. CA-092794]|uniref:zeta toxin family protein n=1 Tax=Dactylosporangium sp. CA-092794 TaxID=3239929 RepID=UPI003D8CACEE
MTGPIDPRRYLLSDEESRRIFGTEIVPDELAHGVPQSDPKVVFVAGQPGAGKTKTTELVKRRLDERGGAVVVNSDFYKPYHPDYARLLGEDDRTAAPYTSMDGRRWMAAAERHLIDHRVDTIIETTMRDPGDFIEPARMFRAAGYRVEAVIMAVPESLSRLGIVERYRSQVEATGHGRLTARENHDASYRGVLSAAGAIDSDRIVDAVTVFRRGNVPLYENTLTPGGDWRDNPRAAAAIEAERNRPWTPDEAQAFATATARLATRTGPQWRDELADIARLAGPLAELHRAAEAIHRARHGVKPAYAPEPAPSAPEPPTAGPLER